MKTKVELIEQQEKHIELIEKLKNKLREQKAQLEKYETNAIDPDELSKLRQDNRLLAIKIEDLHRTERTAKLYISRLEGQIEAYQFTLRNLVL